MVAGWAHALLAPSGLPQIELTLPNKSHSLKRHLKNPELLNTRFQCIHKGGGRHLTQSRTATIEEAVHSAIQPLYKGAIVFSMGLLFLLYFLFPIIHRSF